MGENCASSCKTKAHQTFAECVRSQGQMVGYCRSAAGFDKTTQNNWDKRLDSYKAARSQGIEPSGTKAEQIQAAVAISDAVGLPYKAGS